MSGEVFMSLIKRMGSISSGNDNAASGADNSAASSNYAPGGLVGSGNNSNHTEVVLGSAATSPLPRNTVLQNRYDIEQVLGIGGMSTVYRARDLRFSAVARYCAIK